MVDTADTLLYQQLAEENHLQLPPERRAEYVPMLYAADHMPTGVAAGPAAEAAVNHGRWVADCPNPDCTGATLIARDDRRFFCPFCLNVIAGGLWLPVAWPDDVPAIEAALDVRPTAAQNYDPGETVDDLRTQNDDAASEAAL